MTYDDWKTQSPDDDSLENECGFCGDPCNGNYCSAGCRTADSMERV